MSAHKIGNHQLETTHCLDIKKEKGKPEKKKKKKIFHILKRKRVAKEQQL